MFALNMQDSTTTHEHFQLRARGQEVGQVWGCREDLLEIVEDEQQVLTTKRDFEQIEEGLSYRFFESERLRDAGHDQAGIADGSERDEKDTIGEVGEEVSGDLESEASFADAASPGEGHQAHLWTMQESTDSRYFLLAPDQWGHLRGQVMRRAAFRLGWLWRGKYVNVVLHGQKLSTATTA